MKKILFTFITVNQRSGEMAKTFSKILMKELKVTDKPVISKYHKFRNSYKIEFEKKLSKKINHKMEAIDMASKIGEPWYIYFDSDDDSIELIFNNTKVNRFVKPEFSVIRWAQILTCKE